MAIYSQLSIGKKKKTKKNKKKKKKKKTEKKTTLKWICTDKIYLKYVLDVIYFITFLLNDAIRS